MNTVPIKRICLWSGPRNISTALMYSFAQRSDTQVVDEPLYAHYLSETNADEYHPGAEEVLKEMENDGQKVVQWMLGAHEKPVLFFKQMTHHLVNLDWSFLEHTENIILTRDPREMLPSYAKEVKHPTMRDVGYAKHLELLEYLQEIGQKPIVLVSEKVLKNPGEMLNRLCNSIGIPFERSMLRWEKGARPEDGSWAKYWYQSVHNSTGFKPHQPKKEPFPEYLKPLLEECLPLYEELCKHAI
ncbi:sulfotransferase family protein [Rhodohalobacter sulfatireducens]|uniref:Sulfotransferase family protein n=1 Tax=Rhodohalobacter sulfatireducens TaxID=2911366 RepID=A0ABS9KG49_9BACT|nr:sulfotransferase family protein [Rhodohalobacter sulfatireducens]MCG2589818.1 sulfotransferase family protein [Rhodohalobacter sulfatireducens]